VEQFRRAFLVEASQCVKSLQSVFDTTNASTFASRFDEWRKVDLKATAQMQQHVKELVRLNDAIDDFLGRSATPEEFSSFKDAVGSMLRCSSELRDARKELKANADVIAERAATKVLAAWQTEVRHSSNLLREELEAQRERFRRKDDLQDEQFDQLRTRMDHLRSEFHHQREQLASLESVQRHATDNISVALTDSVKELRDVARQSSEELGDTLRKESSSNLLAFEHHVSGLLVGHSGDPDDACVESRRDSAARDTASEPREHRRHNSTMSILAALCALDERLSEWERTKLKEADHWREETQKLDDTLKETKTELNEVRIAEKQARSEAASLDRRLGDIRQELACVQGDLGIARAGSLVNGMTRLREIEARGAVKINRQNGAITLTTPVAFSPEMPSDDPIGFADPAAFEPVITDVADVLKLFNVKTELQVQVKVPKGEKAPDWEQVAANRALHLRDILANQGVVEDNITTKGVAPAKDDTVLIQLDKGVFAEPPKKGGRK
jgi:hypothetical protein